jgi:hypothetical protein
MGIFDAGIGFLERIRVSALIPRLDIAVEGTARLCTDEHIPIYVAGAPDPPPGPLHIDVSLDMWNKGHQRVAVLEQRHARAAGQDLRDGTTLGTGSFTALTLELGEPKTHCYFSLSPFTQDEPLAARAGDRVEFGLRLGRNGRDRHVRLDIAERR